MNFRRGGQPPRLICGHPVRLDGTQLADYTTTWRSLRKKGEQLHHAKRADTKKKLRSNPFPSARPRQRVVNDQIHA